MRRFDLPLQLVYDTSGVTPIGEIIGQLQAAEFLIGEGVALLPSLIDGLRIERADIAIRHLSQESPLKELIIVTLIVTFQDDLTKEVPGMLDDLFGLNVPAGYETIATVVFLIMVFHGASLAVELLREGITAVRLRSEYASLIELAAAQTGKSPETVRAILSSHLAKKRTLRRVIRDSLRFFKPAKDENAALIVDDVRFGGDLIREIPHPGELNRSNPFKHHDHYNAVRLALHAQDKDKPSEGWAAVAEGVAKRRLKLKLLPPVEMKDVWGQDEVTGDVTIVSDMTADGFKPSEIHLHRLLLPPPKD